MQISFSKYQGTGNDFIIIDNRKNTINLSNKDIAFMCNRHFGIGADGLMLLNSDKDYDFAMKYYNSDGKESSMCGNGGRCIAAFASKLGIIKDKTTFSAIDGIHFAEIVNDTDEYKTVRLKMSDVKTYSKTGNFFLINTGSPHYVEFNDNVNETDVLKKGKLIRYDQRFAPDGLNVNFVEIRADSLFVRTYERGVENETLSCGTGVTAAALAYSSIKNISNINIETKGGLLNVSFEKNGNSFKNIFLQGAASFVFEGNIEV